MDDKIQGDRKRLNEADGYSTEAREIYIPEANATDSMTAGQICRRMEAGIGKIPISIKRIAVADEITGETEVLYQTLYVTNKQLYSVMSREGRDGKQHLTGECYRVIWKNSDIAIDPLKESTAVDEMSYHAVSAFGFCDESGVFRKTQYKGIFNLINGTAVMASNSIGLLNCREGKYIVDDDVKEKLGYTVEDYEMRRSRLMSRPKISNPAISAREKRR